MPARRPALSRAGRLSILFAAAFALSACVPGAEAPAPTPTLAPSPTPAANPYAGATAGSGSGKKIGYVSYGDKVEFVARVSAGVRAQASLAGVELVECDLDVDASNIPTCLKKMADAGVAGLLLFQPELGDPAVACQGLPAGLPVVAIEEPQPCARVLVRADDLRAGQIAGIKVGEWAKARFECKLDAYVSFESSIAARRSALRMQGYRQGFRSVCGEVLPNEQIAPRADTAEGGAVAIGDLLGSLAGKTKILVVSVNDDAARGALEGATNAGRVNNVFVSAQGADTRALAAIRTNDQWIGDSTYFPEAYGATAVPALLDLLAGKTVPAELLIMPAWVDRATIGTLYPN